MVSKTTTSARSRALWTVIDQGASASSNVLLTFVVANLADAHVFGGFAVALAGVRVAISVNRALSGELLVVRRIGSKSGLDSVQAAFGLTLLIALPCAVLLAMCSQFVATDARSPIIAAALALPGVLLEDTWRYAQFAAGNAHRAAVGDVLWLVVQIAIFALVLVIDGGAFLAVAGWGASATVVAVVACAAERARPRLRTGWKWFLAERGTALRFGAEYMVLQLAAQGAIVVVSAVSGLAAAGSLRAAETLFGPATVVILGLRVFAMSDAGRHHPSDAMFRATLRTASVVSVAGAVLVVGVALALPDWLGEALLGESWSGAEDVLLPMGVATVLMAHSSGAFAGLRALGAARESLAVRFAQAPVLLGGSAAGALLANARGAALASPLAGVLGCTLAWRHLDRAAHRVILEGT